MILIGVGSNLSSAAGTPYDTCLAALKDFPAHGISVLRCSPWYETAPVPASEQPWFINGVVEVATAHEPAELLAHLHKIEGIFLRSRTAQNAARTLDLDLLSYNDVIQKGGGSSPVLPHPRLHERAFVMLPLNDLAPAWRHPTLKETAGDLVKRLSPGQAARIYAPSP